MAEQVGRLRAVKRPRAVFAASDFSDVCAYTHGGIVFDALLMVRMSICTAPARLADALKPSGARSKREAVERTLSTLHTVNLGGLELAIEAAKNFRKLRAVGFTVHKTIDTVIATRCIMDGLELLHSDRDFDPFEKHLGLRCVWCEI